MLVFANSCSWIDRIVACVHEDSRDERKAQRYCTMIRDWTETLDRIDRPGTMPLREYYQRMYPNWTDHEIEYHVRMLDTSGPKGVVRRGEQSEIVLHDPIEITTHVATPLNKQYATLAAIHNASRHCAFPLGPWTHKQWVPYAERSDEDRHEWDLALHYEGLIDSVRTLTDADRVGLERMLDEVSADLILHVVSNPAPTSPNGPGDENKEAPLPETQELQGKPVTRCQPAYVRAAASYSWVCKERPDLIPTPPEKYSRAMHRHIKENDCPAYKDDQDQGMNVPAFETWKRQVRAGLADSEGPKASPRAGRPHGKSVAEQAEI